MSASLHLSELLTRILEATNQGEHSAEGTSHIHVFDGHGRLIGIATDAYALHGVFVVEIRK